MYSVEIWGNGGQTGNNLNSLNLAQVWTNIDVDAYTINDGSDTLTAFFTPTADGDATVIKATFWCPTPTKVVSLIEILDPAKGLVLNDPANQLVCHHHRVVLGDLPTASTFNGQTYPWAEWVPSIAGNFMTMASGSYTSHGLNFRPNVAGNIEIYGDAVGGSEQWQLSITFTKLPTASLTRFGTFN